MTASKKPAASGKQTPPAVNLKVTVTVIFVDLIKKPISGLTVRLVATSFSTKEAITDEQGLVTTVDSATRGEEIKIYVKKKNGEFDLKYTAKPKNDINIYTIHSPELHLHSQTKLSSKEQVEEVVAVPSIAVDEVMTSARLFGDLAPFIGVASTIQEEGKVTKDFPTKKKAEVADPATGQKKTEIAIEHHYKVVKTQKPVTISFALLGSRLNYPVSLDISEPIFEEMAKEFKCEIAAIKAVTKTESGDGGYLPNKLPKILFERHRFYALTDPNTKNGKVSGKKKVPHPYAAFPDICNPKPGGYSGSFGEYVRLLKAAKLDRDAAIKSASWGAFQVLAEYHEECGFATPIDLVDACMKSIDGHVKLFQGFLKKPEKKRAIEGLREKDWEKFTTYYNGGNWRKQNGTYPATMKANYEVFSKTDK